MNEFTPSGYLTLEKALEYFGQLNHADECEAEKASSKREFQRLLFAADLSAVVLTDDGILNLLRSSTWGSAEAARIFETGRASISVGDFYFPNVVHGLVLIKQSSIDALFDGDSNDPQENKGERPPEYDSYNTSVYQAVQAMATQRKCSIREAQKEVARYSDTNDGVSPGKKRSFSAIETAYKRGNQ